MSPEYVPSNEDYEKWGGVIRGEQNPEDLTNPFWIWCIKEGFSASQISNQFDHIIGEIGWCFNRMGQAELELPDGREVFIGGEHEDHYDSDFFIYNDVVVKTGKKVQIFGYPESIFPPTDFHTATLVGDSIYLIGSLSYPSARKIGQTQVLCLDIKNWEIRALETHGECPGWIHSHVAEMAPDGESIKIVGGRIQKVRSFPENIDDYSLDLKTHRWQRLTQRRWPSWSFGRVDGERSRISTIRDAPSTREILNSDLRALPNPELTIQILRESLDGITPEQTALAQSLYHSPFDGSIAIMNEDKYRRHHFHHKGIVIRFDEQSDAVTMTVEGELPDDENKLLVSTLLERLSRLESCAYQAKQIEN